jgi:RNA polymerase sigma-70 factor, ECF subfamily
MEATGIRPPMAGGVSPALIPLVYGELHRLAANHIGGDRSSLTLQPIALIHQAFLRLFGSSAPSFQDRSLFLAIVSRVMRHVLADSARKRQARTPRGVPWSTRR